MHAQWNRELGNIIFVLDPRWCLYALKPHKRASGAHAIIVLIYKPIWVVRGWHIINVQGTHECS